MSENIDLPVSVAELLGVFRAAGADAYVVGGAVRDSLIGSAVHDWDVAAPLPPGETAALFTAHGYRVIPTGIKHGTVTVISHGDPIEVTAFRLDGSYTDGRHPDRVEFTTRIEDDLARRDFTVNAMAYSPWLGVCDPFGGREDLLRGIIRCVGDARTRFTEDALRILRAFRFAARLGFEIDGETRAAAHGLASRLSLISAERIAAESTKLFLSARPARYLEDAAVCGVLGYVFPGIPLSGGDFRPADLLPADAPLRMGAVLRRTGLCNHTAVRTALESLRLSNSFLRRAMAAATLPLPEPDGCAVRRFMREAGNADAAISAAVACGEPRAGEVAAIAETVAAEGGPVTMRTLAVNGKKLHAMGFPAGREMGGLLDALLEAATADPSINNEEALLRLACEIGNKNGKKDI